MFEMIISFFMSLGWVANAATILAFLGTLFGFGKYMRGWVLRKSKYKYNSVVNYIKSKKALNDSEVMKSKRIAIVDDQPQYYPVDYLRSSGFKVDVIEKISLARYDFLKIYDLLFLDVTNVVEEDFKRGGFELMKIVRAEMPQILIIGVSSKRYDPTLTEYFKQTDAQIVTPIEEVKCESVIMSTLSRKYSTTFLSNEIDTMLINSDLSQSQQSTIVTSVIKFIDGKLGLEKFHKMVSGLALDLDVSKLMVLAKQLKEIV